MSGEHGVYLAVKRDTILKVHGISQSRRLQYCREGGDTCEVLPDSRGVGGGGRGRFQGTLVCCR